MKTIKWADLKAKMSPEAQARAAERTRELEHELRLNEIRRARGLAQATIAEALDITQSEVSRLERRTDLYISTLRRFIEAMNGELALVARFPDGDNIEIRLDEPAEVPLTDITATLAGLRDKGHEIGEPYLDGRNGRMHVLVDGRALTYEQARLLAGGVDLDSGAVEERSAPPR